MASKLATSATLTDITKLASVLGIFGLFMDYRSEQRASKWHKVGDESTAKAHQETLSVLKEILKELQEQRSSPSGSRSSLQ